MDQIFVSYNRADRQWAEWIAWQLEAAGYNVFIQAWDIRPGSNFVVAMQSASANSERTLAVLSSNYLNAKFTQPEWTAAFAQDPTGEAGILVPVRVSEIQLSGLWVSIVYIDLVGLSEEDAKAALLEGIAHGRAKPSASPSFPGTSKAIQSTVQRLPSFPAPPDSIEPSLKEWSVLQLQNEWGDEEWDVPNNVKKETPVATMLRRELSSLTEAKVVELSDDARRRIREIILADQQSSAATGPRNEVFQLLVPNWLKPQIGTFRRVYLKVDEAFAYLPWELIFIDDKRRSYDPSPVATVIRRALNTHLRTGQTSDNELPFACLIIGDPAVKGLPELRGSSDEARLVAKCLTDIGISSEAMTISLREGPIQIINKLYTRPNFLIHVTGGAKFVRRNSEGLLMGVQLDDDFCLTPAEIGQIEIPPEMMFINFGRRSIEEPSGETNSLGQLAASFSRELMSYGVKVVIISGWAVDNEASQTFVFEIYYSLFSGESLGQAVGKAQRMTYQKHKRANTWGAFHCYGHPDYVLPLEKWGLLRNQPRSNAPA